MNQKCKPGRNEKTWFSRVDTATAHATYNTQPCCVLLTLLVTTFVLIQTWKPLQSVSHCLQKPLLCSKVSKSGSLPGICRSVKSHASDTRQSWLPSHLSVAQPGPHAIKYWLLLQGLMPHSHTQAQGTMHYHRRKMPSLCLHSILYRDQHQGRLLTVKK